MSSCKNCDDRSDYLEDKIPPDWRGCVFWVLMFLLVLLAIGYFNHAKAQERTVYRDRYGNLIGTEIKSGRTAYFRDRYGRINGSSKEWAGTTYYYGKDARLPIASKTAPKPITKLEYYKPQRSRK